MNTSHYGKTYFAWQNPIGEFGGRANLIKFSSHIKPTDNVIDFGCGGAYLLKNISCAKKIGIDINKQARIEAQKNGIKAVSSTKFVANNWADVIISNNTLEHTHNPLNHLKSLFEKLKNGGTCVCIVPCDSQTKKYEENDINKHLFSWSPMNAGNLFTQAGFEIVSVSPFFHKWPPMYKQIEKYFGMNFFHIISFLYGYIARDWIQIKIVARKPQKKS